MTKPTFALFRALLSVLMMLVCLVSAWAQTPSPSPSPAGKFKVVTTDLQILDRFERPYRVTDGTAWVAVRLAPLESQVNESLKSEKVLNDAGVEYPVGGEEFLKFPLNPDGVAQVQLVVFQDPKKNPVVYNLQLILGDPETERLDLPDWTSGLEVAEPLVHADARAPHTSQEKLALGLFVVFATVLLYLLFGRSLFSRMLFNRKSEVSSALGWSNLLILFGVLVLGAVTTGMVLFPLVVWEKTYMIYVLGMGGYLLLMLLAYLVGLVMTRR